MRRRSPDIEIILETDDMLVEIANRLTVIADSIEAQNPADLHNTKDVLDDSNREIVQNIITGYVHECMDILFPFVKTPVRKCCKKTEYPDEIDKYVIVLSFNVMRSDTQIHHLQRLIRSYIVYKSCAEWLEMTLPKENIHQICENKSQIIRQQIVTALAVPFNASRIRIKPHWY